MKIKELRALSLTKGRKKYLVMGKRYTLHQLKQMFNDLCGLNADMFSVAQVLEMTNYFSEQIYLNKLKEETQNG